MRLSVDLPSDISIALRRFGFEMDMEYQDAAVSILRAALIATGHLETDDGAAEYADPDPEGNT